jgi:hypothetical protein
MLSSLHVSIFHWWTECEQRVVIGFLLKENVNHTHRKVPGQFTDDIGSIRNVKRWCEFMKQGPEDLHGDPRSERHLIDFLDIKVLFTDLLLARSADGRLSLKEIA